MAIANASGGNIAFGTRKKKTRIQLSLTASVGTEICKVPVNSKVCDLIGDFCTG